MSLFDPTNEKGQPIPVSDETLQLLEVLDPRLRRLMEIRNEVQQVKDDVTKIDEAVDALPKVLELMKEGLGDLQALNEEKGGLGEGAENEIARTSAHVSLGDELLKAMHATVAAPVEAPPEPVVEPAPEPEPVEELVSGSFEQQLRDAVNQGQRSVSLFPEPSDMLAPPEDLSPAAQAEWIHAKMTGPGAASSGAIHVSSPEVMVELLKLLGEENPEAAVQRLVEGQDRGILVNVEDDEQKEDA